MTILMNSHHRLMIAPQKILLLQRLLVPGGKLVWMVIGVVGIDLRVRFRFIWLI